MRPTRLRPRGVSLPEAAIGRILLAGLFIAGAMQKTINPEPVKALLEHAGFSGWFVWPALFYNGFAGIFLLLGLWTRPIALSLALYCLATSIFHFIPADGWQISIFVKNWAIAGGLLVLAEHNSTRNT